MKEARARLLRTVSPGRTVTSADPAVGRPDSYVKGRP